MSLTQEQVEQFHAEGYVIAPGLLTREEAGALAAEVTRLQREGKIRNVRTRGDGATRDEEAANLQLIPLYPHSDLFRALPYDPRVMEAVSKLIGSPAALHLDQLFLKPAHHGAGTDWHQDNAYFRMPDPLKGTAMWVAAHDATIANGTLNVIPGSYKEQLAHDRDPNSDHHIHCVVDESRAVACEVEAGGAVFFCYGTAHATRANTTDRDRAGVAYHFVHGDFAHLISETWGERWLTGPKASGGEKEYGVRVQDTFVDHARAVAAEA